MRFAAWYGCMCKPDSEGVTPRDSYAQRARRGDPLAQLYYEGPPVSRRAHYLWDWTLQLRQWAGVIPMGGLGPIGPAIDPWSRFTGHVPDPDELSVLFAIDGVLRHPPESVTLTLPDEDADG
jgi:hypothetical protein